jgi:hypothetical protein
MGFVSPLTQPCANAVKDASREGMFTDVDVAGSLGWGKRGKEDAVDTETAPSRLHQCARVNEMKHMNRGIDGRKTSRVQLLLF